MKKHVKESHASSAKKGMGNYYGTGIRAKIGRMRSGSGMYAVDKEKIKIPPRSVV